ncbi:Flp pilus assembly protein TadB [Haloactinospora alba]|uniref:Flp pilus assembly protein TadB n=1 Tax=Haloactinospora alba TaxID=405555 RepID=A0A543NA63_9ACTN|nr:type II secretion system F family protein [Haloactinospora alba]TQN28708.1 Flp pilus assembly protein TadB [Haloactinospora alba]
MTVLEIAVVALGTAAVWLLTAAGGPTGRARLAALLDRRRPGLRRFRSAGTVRVVVACVPPVALAVLLGPLPGAVAGALPGFVLWWWAGRRNRGNGRRGHARIAAGVPLVVDLLVAGLRAGGTTLGVVAAVGEAVEGPLGSALEGVARRLRLGEEPAAAWEQVDGPAELAAVGRAFARAAETGAPAADVLERYSAELRSDARTRAHAHTQRVGVWVVAPLGVCFLPAFVLIGVVPLAAGLLVGVAPG